MAVLLHQPGRLPCPRASGRRGRPRLALLSERETIGRDLVLDELFDLTLYKELHKLSRGEIRAVLSELIPVETRHVAFWKNFYGLELDRLDLKRRLKLFGVLTVCRVLGPVGVHLTLEAIEVYGVRKYLSLWERHRDDALGGALRQILPEEFAHEDEIVSRVGARRIAPQRVRSMFLGFNDGLVEILGAVTGFYAALGEARLVLMAGVSVAAAGAFSMAAGAAAAASSEGEIERLERDKRLFLGEAVSAPEESGPWQTGLIVGVSYLLGAVVPLLPVALGARSIWAPAAAGAALTIVVSVLVSFLSGMRARRRVALNLATAAGAVVFSFMVGAAVKRLWGVAL